MHACMGRMAECRSCRWPFTCTSPALALTANTLSKRSSVYSFRWSFYETIVSYLHPRPACRLRPKPDSALDAVRRAVDGGARCRYDERGQESCRHRAAGSKLSVRADTAERICHSWLYSCHCRLRWKSWHAIIGERQLTRGIAIRCCLLPGIQQIAQYFTG